VRRIGFSFRLGGAAVWWRPPVERGYIQVPSTEDHVGIS
jgi:hypothetical protein